MTLNQSIVSRYYTKAQITKGKIGKLNFIQVKPFWVSKSTIKKWKDSSQMGENINQISDKGPEYMKNSYNSRIKR